MAKPPSASSPTKAGLIDPSLFPDHQQPQAAVDPDGSIASSTIRERERNQLRVVAEGLAPQLVLDQPLSVPTAPPTFRLCLAQDAPLLPLSVLRACINEASTNALFSSATSLDASPEETTRLLNEVDSFQTTVLGLLDEVERRYASAEKSAQGSNGIKRELDEDEDVMPASTAKKYMLHRGGANGGDLFTSAAFLSDRDLEAVSLLPDADLVAVHPPPVLAPSNSLSSSAPSLGSLHPPYPPPPSFVPVSVRYNFAPGLAPAVAPTLPALVPPAGAPRAHLPLARETRMLDYGVWSSGFAPTFDSSGSTDGGYYRAAKRASGRERVKKWEKSLVPVEPLPRIRFEEPDELAGETEGRELDLTAGEKQTLGELEVELSDFLQFTKKAGQDEARVWRTLERNLELIQRLGSAQVARTRKSAKKEERKKRSGKTVSRKNGAGTEGVAGEEETRDEERRDLAEGVEKQDADTLLESFTSLLSSFYRSSVLPSLDANNPSPPSLLPAPSLVRSLAPLIVGELARESSYTGALEPLEGMGGKGWEKAVKEGAGSVKQE